jgi:hypothetical protein
MQPFSWFKDKHKGQTCAILGGGVSLPADLRSIEPVDCLIGVNQHSLILPLDYLVFSDRHMWEFVEPYKDIMKITNLNKFNDRSDVIHAGETPPVGFSGAKAVWCAVEMGFERIYVCGMDQYEDKDGREYWWQGPQSWPFKAAHMSARTDLTRWKEFIENLRYPERVFFVSGRLKEIHQ